MFGERFLAPDFARACQYRIIDWFTTVRGSPLYESVIYAYQNLPSDSLVLKVLVDAHCQYFEPEMDNYDDGALRRREQLPQKFLLSCVLKYAEKGSLDQMEELDRCDYHGHTTSEERKACQIPVLHVS